MVCRPIRRDHTARSAWCRRCPHCPQPTLRLRLRPCRPPLLIRALHCPRLQKFRRSQRSGRRCSASRFRLRRRCPLARPDRRLRRRLPQRRVPQTADQHRTPPEQPQIRRVKAEIWRRLALAQHVHFRGRPRKAVPSLPRIHPEIDIHVITLLPRGHSCAQRALAARSGLMDGPRHPLPLLEQARARRTHRALYTAP